MSFRDADSIHKLAPRILLREGLERSPFFPFVMAAVKGQPKSHHSITMLSLGNLGIPSSDKWLTLLGERTQGNKNICSIVCFPAQQIQVIDIILPFFYPFPCTVYDVKSLGSIQCFAQWDWSKLCYCRNWPWVFSCVVGAFVDLGYKGRYPEMTPSFTTLPNS